jgi:hypothetical protein
MSSDMNGDVNARARLVGAWQLTSYRRFRDGVFYRETMGANPVGRILYTESGYMCAFLLSADWARREPVAFSWNTFLSYSARWELIDERTVHHYVDMASVQDFIGRTFVRWLTWNDDGSLTLTTDGHTSAQGQHVHDELTWRREIDADR